MPANDPGAGAPACVHHLDGRARHVTTPCGDGTMRWRIWGEGPPLVLLHGGFGSWQHWVRNIEFLSGRVQVIAGDLPGLGDSDEAPQPHTAAAIAEVLHEGIRRILGDSAPLSLAGFSLGGAIAAALAARLERRVDQLLLFSPSALGAFWQEVTQKLLRWQPDAGEQERLATVRANLAISMIADPEKIDDDAVAIQDRLVRQKRRLKGLPISTSDAALQALRNVKGRTTIIWGERDPYLRPDAATCAEQIRTLYPLVGTQVLAGAGHWVIYEAHEAANRLILDRLGLPAVQEEKLYP